MNIEGNLIISLLKLTREGAVSLELVKKDAKLPLQIVEKLLRKLQNDGCVYLQKSVVEADSLQRVKLAVYALQLGADVENVSSFLHWKEFEDIAALAFERNGYGVYRNVRFKYAGRRWEIDVVGCKKPIAVCLDCKHWHHGVYPSVLRKIVEEQVERAFIFAESLPNPFVKIECVSWERIKFVPAVLLLVPGRFKFYDGVPIIPVLQLQDFLTQLPALVDSLKHLTKDMRSRATLDMQ
ncbi:hypothetical protein HM003_04975 [Candidatus Bathyarchaeota archaeon A05DMB-5]|nr:hypothetical protein [Candidatus Bathyarchaeota archaeon A05DMB-5]